MQYKTQRCMILRSDLVWYKYKVNHTSDSFFASSFPYGIFNCLIYTSVGIPFILSKYFRKTMTLSNLLTKSLPCSDGPTFLHDWPCAGHACWYPDYTDINRGAPAFRAVVLQMMTGFWKAKTIFRKLLSCLQLLPAFLRCLLQKIHKMAVLCPWRWHAAVTARELRIRNCR